MGLARTNDGLLACNLREPSAMLYKFALDGSMDELATVPALADYGQGFMRCAVHQQTQRTYAIGDGENGRNAVVILDANLQAIATVEATGDAPDDFDDDYGPYEPIRDVAVHGNQVIVLTSVQRQPCYGLRAATARPRWPILAYHRCQAVSEPQSCHSFAREGLCG